MAAKKKGRLYTEKSLLYELERLMYVPGTETVLEARPLVSLLKYHELQGNFFCAHEWSWPPTIMRLANVFCFMPESS
jgi:hypothetical protein